MKGIPGSSPLCILRVGVGRSFKGDSGFEHPDVPISNPELPLADPKTVSEALGGLTEGAGWAGPAYRVLRLGVYRPLRAAIVHSGPEWPKPPKTAQNTNSPVAH